LKVIHKRTVKGIVISNVSFNVLGGASIGTGIEQTVFKRSAYNRAGNVLAGFALFVCEVCWAAMLLRRVRAELPK